MNSLPFFSLILKITFPELGDFLKSSNVFFVNNIRSYINPAYFTAIGYSREDILNLKGTPLMNLVNYHH